jgi:hypothetical protein
VLVKKEFSNMSGNHYQKNDEAIYFPNIGQTGHYISISLLLSLDTIAELSQTWYTTVVASQKGLHDKDSENAYHHGCSRVQNSADVGLSRPVIHNSFDRPGIQVISRSLERVRIRIWRNFDAIFPAQNPLAPVDADGA